MCPALGVEGERAKEPIRMMQVVPQEELGNDGPLWGLSSSSPKKNSPSRFSGRRDGTAMKFRII